MDEIERLDRLISNYKSAKNPTPYTKKLQAQAEARRDKLANERAREQNISITESRMKPQKTEQEKQSESLGNLDIVDEQEAQEEEPEKKEEDKPAAPITDTMLQDAEKKRKQKEQADAYLRQQKKL
jgi:hypothetical protein